MRRLSVLLVLVAALGLVLAACGGDDGGGLAPAPTPPTAPTASPAVTGAAIVLGAAADGSLAYGATTLDVEAGEITIAFSNPSSTPHNVAVEGEGIDTVFGEIVTAGEAPITLTLEPGTYTFFCSVPGHRSAGMEGTITVS